MKICELKIGPKTIIYKIKNNTLAKRLTLSIKSSGEIIVTKPPYVSYKSAQNFVDSRIEWIHKNYSEISKKNENYLQKRDQVKKEYETLRKKTMELVKSRIALINKYYGYRYNKIIVRNQKTRWGSCSKKKTLSFNYKLIKLPLKHVDYVITHELCHLKEFNHSKKFWSLVESTIPDYKKLRKELKSFEL